MLTVHGFARGHFKIKNYGTKNNRQQKQEGNIHGVGELLQFNFIAKGNGSFSGNAF